jgi:hypothetical protein
MDSGLTIAFLWEDVDAVELQVTASNGRFSGAARIYISPSQLYEAAALLKDFPAKPSDTRELTFGSFAREIAGGAVKLHFRCVDSCGHAQADIKIESDPLQGPSESAIFFLPIEATAVDRFVDDLTQLAQDRTHIARLTSMTSN